MLYNARLLVSLASSCFAPQMTRSNPKTRCSHISRPCGRSYAQGIISVMSDWALPFIMSISSVHAEVPKIEQQNRDTTRQRKTSADLICYSRITVLSQSPLNHPSRHFTISRTILSVARPTLHTPLPYITMHLINLPHSHRPTSPHQWAQAHPNPPTKNPKK